MATNQSSPPPDALLSLLEQLKQSYQALPPVPPKRGKPPDFTDRSFFLLAAVAVTLRTFGDSELHRLLTHDPGLRHALEFPRLPHRTTIGRRLVGLVEAAEQQIAALGQVLVRAVTPTAEQPQASSLDGRMYQAVGPRWHTRDRAQDRLPTGLRNVDTESQWSKSGYRGWVQGYRLLLQSLVFPHPVPLAACWRPNNQGEAQMALAALETGRLVVTDVLLGDSHFGGGLFPYVYEEAGGWVLTSQRLPEQRRSWKHDLFGYRKETIELLFQRIIQVVGWKQCPVKGEGRNGAFVLASVWLYQVCFLSNYRQGQPAACIKEQVDRARWRIPSG